MTTGTLQNIRQLNEEGSNDLEIAEILGLSNGVVSYWRKYLGLKPVRRHRTKKWYKVTDVWTEKVLCSGTARECAQALGIDIESFYCEVSRWKRSGKGRREYEVQ